MQIIFKKITAGRGRPSKLVVLDDGTEVKYSDYLLQHPEIKSIAAPVYKKANKANPAQTPIEGVSSIPTASQTPLKQIGRGVLVEQEGTVPTRTVFGTPVNIESSFYSKGGFMGDVMVIVNANTPRAYKTSIHSRDLVKPEILPPELAGIPFARQQGEVLVEAVEEAAATPFNEPIDPVAPVEVEAQAIVPPAVEQPEQPANV